MSFSFSAEEAPWLCKEGASLLSLPNDVLLRISAAARPEDAFRLSVCNSRLHGLMNEDYWQLRAQSMGAELNGSATAVCQLFGVVQGFCASCATPVLVPWEDLSPRGLPALEGRQQSLFPNAVSHWILKLWFCPACISNPCFFYVSEAHLSIWHLGTADLAGLPSKLVDGSLWYRYHDVVQRKSIKTSFLAYGHGGGDHTLVPMGLDHSFLQAANFNFTLQNRLTAEALSMQLLAALATGEQHLPIGPSAPASGSGTGDQTRVVPPGCANSNILPPELFPQYAQAHLLAQPWHYKDVASSAQATPASSMMPAALATLDTPRSRAGSLASRPPHFFIHNGSPSEEHVWRHTQPLQSAGATTFDDPRSIAGSSARPLTASTSASTSRHGITATPETGIMSLAHGESDERKPGPSRSAASPSDGDGSPEPQQKKRRRPPAKTPEEKAAREREKEEAKRLRAEEREREKQRKAFEREIEKQRKAAEREKEAKRKALEKHAQAVKAAAEGQDRPPAPKKSKTSTSSSSSSKTAAPRPTGARSKATPTPKKATPGKRKVTECSTDSESQDQLAGPSSSIDPQVKVESQGIRLPVGTDDSAEGQEDGMSSALATDDEDDDDDLAGRPRPDISHLIGMSDDEARRQIIRDVKREHLDDALKARGFQMVKNRTSPEIEAWVDYKWAELLSMGITCVEDVVQRLLDQFGTGALAAASASQQRREQQAQSEAELPLTATQEGAAATNTAQHQGDSSGSADRSFETFATANEHVTPRSRGASGNVMNLAALMHGAGTNGLGHAESSQNTRRNIAEAERLLHLANSSAPRQQHQQQAHQRQPSLPQPQQHFSPTSYGSLQGLIDADNVYGAYMQQASDLSHSHQRRASVHSRSHSQQQIQLQQQQQHRRTPSITGGSALLFGAPGESSAAVAASSSSSNNIGGVQKSNAAALSPTISSQGRKSLIYGTEGNDAAADATAASLTDHFEADSLAFSSSLLAAEEAAARHERS